MYEWIEWWETRRISRDDTSNLYIKKKTHDPNI